MSLLASQVPDDPWSRLWLAVLDRALVDAYIVTGAIQSDRRWMRGARSWLGGPRFKIVCEQAGLDPVWVRQTIARYAAQRAT